MVMRNTGGGASNHSNKKSGGLSKKVTVMDKFAAVVEKGLPCLKTKLRWKNARRSFLYY